MSNKNVTAVSARVAARLPLDLVAWVDAQPGTRTEIVEAALSAMRQASKPTSPPAAAVGSLMKGKP